MSVVLLVCGLIFGFCFVLLKWNEVRFRGKCLPPGTMGWPVFGETLDFLKHGPDFMKTKRARYGSFFKTHILGCPTIISMDPEVNRYILLNEAKGLVPGYPQSMLDLVGKSNIVAVHGPAHKHIRGSLLSLVGPPLIKDQLLPKIDHFMRTFLDGWHDQTIDLQEKTVQMALFISMKQIFEHEYDSMRNGFKPEFDKLFIGTLSLPINFPGTNYNCGVQGRKNVVKILKEIMKSRRDSPASVGDMLDRLLTDKYELNEEQILDQVITILNSGYETMSTTSMMALKYLHDHPTALQQLREENLAIRRRKAAEDPIDWSDYKSMSFTRAVVYETSRLATIVNGVLRKTTKDIELNGYIIPKSWKIYVYTREINYDPILYPEPFTFNPWRWLQNPKLETHNYCFLFGGGTRLCPGKELGMAKISMFLHYFVTQYKFELVGHEEILKFPRVEAPNGLHIRVSNAELQGLMELQGVAKNEDTNYVMEDTHPCSLFSNLKPDEDMCRVMEDTPPCPRSAHLKPNKDMGRVVADTPPCPLSSHLEFEVDTCRVMEARPRVHSLPI